jgi:hypothetical protein
MQINTNNEISNYCPISLVKIKKKWDFNPVFDVQLISRIEWKRFFVYKTLEKVILPVISK